MSKKKSKKKNNSYYYTSSTGIHSLYNFTIDTIEAKEVHQLAEDIFGKSYYISYDDLVL